jgi:hypothetical protein
LATSLQNVWVISDFGSYLMWDLCNVKFELHKSSAKLRRTRLPYCFTSSLTQGVIVSTKLLNLLQYRQNMLLPNSTKRTSLDLLTAVSTNLENVAWISCSFPVLFMLS